MLIRTTVFAPISPEKAEANIRFADPGLAVAGDLYSPKGHTIFVSIYNVFLLRSKHLPNASRTTPSQVRRFGPVTKHESAASVRSVKLVKGVVYAYVPISLN